MELQAPTKLQKAILDLIRWSTNKGASLHSIAGFCKFKKLQQRIMDFIMDYMTKNYGPNRVKIFTKIYYSVKIIKVRTQESIKYLIIMANHVQKYDAANTT